MKLYVGNLPFSITEAQLRAHFAAYGRILSIHLPTHPDSGRARGFGFVEFADDTEGRRAINATHDLPLAGRNLIVNDSEAREARDGRFGKHGGYWKR